MSITDFHLSNHTLHNTQRSQWSEGPGNVPYLTRQAACGDGTLLRELQGPMELDG